MIDMTTTISRQALLAYIEKVNPPFFLSGLGMPSNTLENQVGEERDGRGVYDLEPPHPFRRSVLVFCP